MPTSGAKGVPQTGREIPHESQTGYVLLLLSENRHGTHRIVGIHFRCLVLSVLLPVSELHRGPDRLPSCQPRNPVRTPGGKSIPLLALATLGWCMGATPSISAILTEKGIDNVRSEHEP